MDIANRQNVRKISIRALRKYIKKIFSLLGLRGKRASFVLCDNCFIAALNKEYFKQDKPTDVISFPLADEYQPCFLGEVIVSVEEAVSAAAGGGGWERELLLYVIHGVLHLTGYRDKAEAQRKQIGRKQEKVRAQLGKINLTP